VLINKEIFYIHIPRTGGRFISYLFLKNAYNCEFHQFHNKYNDPLKKVIEVPHLEYPYYEPLYNYKPVSKFSIIRDPVDRFISMLSCVNPSKKEISIIFKNQESLNTFINRKIIETQSNWFVPQCKFISYDTKLWKYENGLEDEFFEWIYDNFNVYFKNTKVVYDKVDYDFNKKIKLSNKQKELVKNYYYQDYKIFT